MSVAWDKRFLRLAWMIADWSKDPGTKCGAVLVRKDKTIASLGFNGFPAGIQDRPDMLNARERKLERVIHAEMNALLFHREDRRLTECCMYVYPALPCCRCAAHIIQSGVRRVVSLQGNMIHWAHEMEVSRELFAEANVEVQEYEDLFEAGPMVGPSPGDVAGCVPTRTGC